MTSKVSKILLIAILCSCYTTGTLFSQVDSKEEFNEENILVLMNKVNQHFLDHKWRNVDRNWKRGTFYTGLMAFYKVCEDSNLYNQSYQWGAKHSWHTGTEFTFPANRLSCSQTYLELYKINPNPIMIESTKTFIDKRKINSEHAIEQGWDYIDALYVGCPAIAMMGVITKDTSCYIYMNKLFWEVADTLIDNDDKLFYRDLKAKTEKSKNGKKVLWSRGNGWIIASIPRILENLPKVNPKYDDYVSLLQIMAKSIKSKQGEDGFWRSNLADPLDYPMPESSGTALFTYALAWGINNDILETDEYYPTIKKAWNALYHVVDENGKVCWGQTESRDPGTVNKRDSDEFVSGVFMLAGSEIYKLLLNENYIEK